jgi:choline dehydrogenase
MGPIEVTQGDERAKDAEMSESEYDYIVVGSGAGGAPLACNLAKAGYRVLVLEAGGDDEPPNYQVPAFHGFAAEDAAFRWDFFVRHYDDETRQRADTKYSQDRNGILYPRCGTLGGCTAHNAMITVYPHISDWERLAEVTKDPSWGPEAMHRYFERMERCTYTNRWGQYTPNPVLAFLAMLWVRFVALLYRLIGRRAPDPRNPGRHGFDGWLTTSSADPSLLLEDPSLVALVVVAAKVALFGKIGRLFKGVATRFDPNDWRNVRKSREGIALTPLAINQGRRNGTREYLSAVRRERPELLTIELHALATRVLFEGDTAVGVEYMKGARLYRADPNASRVDGERRTVRARREVILAGGAFNTPQLLKLSGIGPRAELERFGIPVVADLPGVGENLHDRYEVGVISELRSNSALTRHATFRAPGPGEEPDRAYREWLRGRGPYTTNGVTIAIAKKSTRDCKEPDLYVFGIPGAFKGYYPGYANDTIKNRDLFTWVVLKAHTNNTAGSVTLTSPDPRDVPHIAFRYFDEGNDPKGADLAGVIDGIRFARRIMSLARVVVKREVLPGDDLTTDEQLGDFVKREAWGHHACGTCKIGADDDPLAVLDGRFRVRKTRGLRVVDASIFPHIPGLFIISAVYMSSEKASDIVLEDARAEDARARTASPAEVRVPVAAATVTAERASP